MPLVEAAGARVALEDPEPEAARTQLLDPREQRVADSEALEVGMDVEVTEQVRLEPPDTRTDVYSAMVIVWELLARRKAVQRGTLPDAELLKKMAAPKSMLPPLSYPRESTPGGRAGSTVLGCRARRDLLRRTP